MKKTKMFLIIISVIFFQGISFSGTIDSSTVIGFSPDGRYAAYKISGIQDGSGFLYEHIRFIDIHRNRFVGPHIHRVLSSENESAKQFYAIINKQAAPFYRKYKIDKNIKGTECILTNYGDKTVFLINGKKNSLILKEIETDEKGVSMAGPTDIKGFSLSLNGKILDRSMRPSGRYAGAFAYSLNKVIYYKNYALIFFSAATPGFEGASSVVLVSSGRARN